MVYGYNGKDTLSGCGCRRGKVLTGEKRYGTTENFLEPAIIMDIPEDARCYREEIFAPVVALYAFFKEEEVLTKANDSEYGLAAYIFTTNLNRSLRIAEALEAGTVGVNDPVPSTSNCPFGGLNRAAGAGSLEVKALRTTSR